MIVIGTDTHKRTHIAVEESGQLGSELTAAARPRRLARAERSIRVMICRELSAAMRARTRRVRQLQRELAVLVYHLLNQPPTPASTLDTALAST